MILLSVSINTIMLLSVAARVVDSCIANGRGTARHVDGGPRRADTMSHDDEGALMHGYGQESAVEPHRMRHRTLELMAAAETRGSGGGGGEARRSGSGGRRTMREDRAGGGGGPSGSSGRRRAKPKSVSFGR
eukprot:COSAG06_NODE_15618_length_1057_cov_140.269311_1_plen_132_part_00